MNRVIATMSAVFAPFVYILAASGLLQSALILLKPEFRKRIRSMQDAEAMTTCDVKMQEFSMPNGDGSL